MTRQRAWQLKMKEQKRCTICGKPAKKTLCDRHLKKARDRSEARRKAA